MAVINDAAIVDTIVQAIMYSPVGAGLFGGLWLLARVVDRRAEAGVVAVHDVAAALREVAAALGRPGLRAALTRPPRAPKYPRQPDEPQRAAATTSGERRRKTNPENLPRAR
jgi:hypothetical protein